MGRRTRPWLAAVLALAIAGLGHVYLRRWGRAIAWFVTIVGSGVALVYLFATPETPVGDLPPDVLVPIAGLFLLSAVDAYRIGRSGPSARGGSDGPTCPNCGGELDEGIDFCPWCAEPLSERARAEGERPAEY
ncbi:MAG: zinc ribbon domain-containing protein [Salinigranum sp.]